MDPAPTALALRLFYAFSACCTALGLLESCRNHRRSCTAWVCQGWTGSECFQAAAPEYQVQVQPASVPPPFCSSALPPSHQSVTNTVSARLHGEGKGADKAHGVAWEQAGLVQGTDLRITCTFSQDPGLRRECWLLRREPTSDRPSTGSCHRARSTAGPGQRLSPCMCSGAISGHLLSTTPKRARAI